jgi:hypothetical protein
VTGPVVAIVANPHSGRDVRRLAARAAAVPPEHKRDVVARIAAGLDAAGVGRILVLDEPFRISTGALERMPLRATVEPVGRVRTHDAGDTIDAVRRMRELGCGTFVVLGGDGTSRAVAAAAPDGTLVPVATGTNNVFPQQIEATAAGLAAGLAARGLVDTSALRPCKRVEVRDAAGAVIDFALVDAVLLRRDLIGNRMPFDPDRLATVVLSRAEPFGAGTSPIGGWLCPVGPDEPGGVVVQCVPSERRGDAPASDPASAPRRLTVPIAPGTFADVFVEGCRRVADGEPVPLFGEGILALDGDRLHRVGPGRALQLAVDRTGPPVLDVRRALAIAARQGVLAEQLPPPAVPYDPVPP